jgi:hypothetical protein
MRERALIWWTGVLVAIAHWLQRRLVKTRVALQEINFRRQAAEYHADILRIEREAAESERRLREQ